MREPAITALVLAILAAAVGGLLWLLFKRCKFSLAQILVALGIYGLAMAVTRFLARHESVEDARQLLAVWGGLHAAAIGVGLFLGARNLREMPSGAPRLHRWFVFCFNIFVVYCLILAVGILMVLTAIIFFR